MVDSQDSNRPLVEVREAYRLDSSVLGGNSVDGSRDSLVPDHQVVDMAEAVPDIAANRCFVPVAVRALASIGTENLALNDQISNIR